MITGSTFAHLAARNQAGVAAIGIAMMSDIDEWLIIKFNLMEFFAGGNVSKPVMCVVFAIREVRL